MKIWLAFHINALKLNSIYSTNFKLSLCGIKFIQSGPMIGSDKRWVNPLFLLGEQAVPAEGRAVPARNEVVFMRRFWQKCKDNWRRGPHKDNLEAGHGRSDRGIQRLGPGLAGIGAGGLASGLPGSGGEVPLLAAGKRETAERGDVQGAPGMETVIFATEAI
ncbi:MAG TPA: hypothetical protein P5204_00865 [Kiritimatiellia bacterium]|nr:hypothetical protein [Kiritimatiellia bacterium]